MDVDQIWIKTVQKFPELLDDLPYETKRRHKMKAPSKAVRRLIAKPDALLHLYEQATQQHISTPLTTTHNSTPVVSTPTE